MTETEKIILYVIAISTIVFGVVWYILPMVISYIRDKEWFK